MSLNSTSHPIPSYLDSHFISHYRTVQIIFSVISNVFTIITLTALYRQKFHLRRVIFLSTFFPNLLLSYSFLFLQPLIILPHPVIHLLGPLQISGTGNIQLLIWSFLLISTLAVFAYSLLYIFFTAILRSNSWNQLTVFLLSGLSIALCTVNVLLLLTSSEHLTPISITVTFPKWSVNYAFIEYLVLLMMGCGIITFTIERAVTSMKEVQLMKQRTVNMQWSLLKLLVSYGAIFLIVFAIPGFFLLSSLQFTWKMTHVRPLFYLTLLVPSALACPAVFMSHFLYIKQFQLAVSRKRNTISPIAK